MVANRANILDALDIMRELTHKPYDWDYNIHHNSERFIKHAWNQKNLNVKQFPRVQFGVATKDDTTRWQTGETELPSHPGLIVKYKREWFGAQNGCVAHWGQSDEAQEKLRQYQRQGLLSQEKKEVRDFTIVILTMNRLNSLQRLVRSLMHPDCQYGKFDISVNVEFHIDRPKNTTIRESWLNLIRWTSNVSWPHGSVKALVARENMGLRDAWFHAWKPVNEDDRAIILEDDVEVSPSWFLWVNKAYDAYSHEGEVAGFSLQRQDVVPLTDKEKRQKKVQSNNNEPFLYSLLGSIGFSPNAKVWKEFLGWTECALCKGIDVSVDGLVTTRWYNHYDKKSMWEQHLVYYMYHKGLYCLYQFPKNETQALALHWNEKGEHNTGGRSAHDKVQDLGDVVFPEIGSIQRYDWGANLMNSTMPKTLLLSAAVGYKDLSLYSTFLSTLRTHYKGDVMLLLEKRFDPEIKIMLQEYNIMHAEVDGSKSWHGFNIERFKFYSTYCKRYEYCMALDFRDSFFQGDPFSFLKVEAKAELILQTHNIKFGQKAKGIPAHWKMIPTCANFNETLAEEYRSCLMDKYLINAGGIAGKGHIFQQLESTVIGMAKEEDCSDQMALNIGVYCDMLPNLSTVKVYKQGTGPINTLGYGSQYLKLGERVGNLDCFPSPVVHQGDLLNLSAPSPLGDSCVADEYEKRDLPEGGYMLVPIVKPPHSTEWSPFQPVQEVLLEVLPVNE